MMRVELLTVVFRIKFSTMTKDNFCIVIPTTDKKKNHHFNRLQEIDKDHFQASEAVDQLTSIIQLANH